MKKNNNTTIEYLRACVQWVQMFITWLFKKLLTNLWYRWHFNQMLTTSQLVISEVYASYDIVWFCVSLECYLIEFLYDLLSCRFKDKYIYIYIYIDQADFCRDRNINHFPFTSRRLVENNAHKLFKTSNAYSSLPKMFSIREQVFYPNDPVVTNVLICSNC